MSERETIIYGRHAVLEVLREKPEAILELWIRDDIHHVLKIPSDVTVTSFSGTRLPVPLPKTATHQGFIAKLNTAALFTPYHEAERIWQTADVNAGLIILGELQDPHNVGAVIRSAAAFGITAVLLPKHRQTSLTAAVVKVSAGMVFTVPIVEITNVNRTITDLQKQGFFVYGLAGNDGQAVSLPQEKFTHPTAFVLGSEDTGLRAKTAEHCDTLLSIPMHERCESLNAATAAAVVFYAWSIQRT